MRRKGMFLGREGGGTRAGNRQDGLELAEMVHTTFYPH